MSICFALLSSKEAKACGPIMDDFEGYSFLMPKLLKPVPANAPFLTDFNTFYDDYVGAAEAQAQDNVSEWVDIFCQSVRREDVAKVIYGLSLRDMELLQTATQSKNMPLSPELRMNSFAKHLKKHKCTETMDYLVFAKRCEPHVTVPEDSWKLPARNSGAMSVLIEETRPRFSKIKSNYLRLRYAYQLIRLAHYQKDYRKVLALYDELMPQIRPVESIMHYWIMGHRAGALYRLGEKVEAAYLFSLVFMNCEGKKESAFQSFRIETDEEWEQCYQLCKTNGERANLYALRAHAQESKAVEEMIKIYDLSPQEENLELLLVNEIKKLEKDLLGLDFNDKKRINKKLHKLPRKKAGEYVITLRGFANKLGKEGKVLHPNLWKMAEAYLEFLSGDYYAASRSFSALEGKVENPILEKQLEVWQLALRIAQYENIDREVEDEVAEIIRENKYYKEFKDFPDYLNDKLAHEYTRNNRPGKAFRMQYTLFDLKANPQLNIVNDLLEICREEKPTRFERAIIATSDGGVITNDLLDMNGSILLGASKPEAALEAFKMLPRDQWENILLWPFRDSLSDCVNCYPVDSSAYYSKVGLLEKIFELEYQAKADYQNSGAYFYQIGLAYYNMTYFGTAWKAQDYFRSGANWDYSRDQIFQKAFFPYGNREFHDCSKALFYFDKAIELAINREDAAKACFMAARCEQKRFFTSKDSDYSYYSNQVPVLPEGYRRHYDLLINEYNETAFYQEAIRECSFFAAYAN
ncbi:MAG: hypothetical protein AB8F74_12320 [Saprospiraceae bacterium]